MMLESINHTTLVIGAVIISRCPCVSQVSEENTGLGFWKKKHSIEQVLAMGKKQDNHIPRFEQTVHQDVA